MKPSSKLIPPGAWERTRSTITRMAIGGNWAAGQSDTTRRNLVWFWFDGFFSSASDNIIITYLVVYLLALGATQAQIGLMSSLSSLSAAAVLLPGAMLAERVVHRRYIVLAGGGWARIALLFIALLPLFLPSSWVVVVAIGFSITRDAMANLSFPAWMAMTADIVPLAGRGRYFASRNFIMGISGMVVTFLAGLLISFTPHPAGYQIALGVAFLIGTLSIYSFAHISDAPRPLAYPQAAQPLAFRALLKEMVTHREFTTFIIITAMWNFSLNVAGPFFNVYLVKNLHADATMIALTTIASSAVTILAQRKIGELNDRWGASRLVMVSGLLIPVLPWLWSIIDAAWYVILINLVGGVLWGAYNLASFNYLLMITPEHRRARYSALFQMVVMISLAIGAAVGSLIITVWSYQGVFLGSGVGRLITAVLFVFLLARKPAKPGAKPEEKPIE